MNIIDYIKKHENEDFKDFAFTEVDNLIFSCLPYIDYTGIVPAFKKKKVTLNEVAKKLENENTKGKAIFVRNTYKMLQAMRNTKRYGNTLMYHYMNIVNNKMQFGALTLKLNDKSIFVAFAGTDTSIIGWKEDFNLSYLYPGVGQKYAAIYLNKTIGLFDKNVRIGGHSKGGNLAICSSMNSKFYIKRKIKQIYNNDGPGFLKEQVESKEYKMIQNKIKMYVPEQSIIGMILYHVSDYEVVKAKGFNILQHDAFNWQCDDNSFIKAKLSKRSQNVEKKITQKLEELPVETRLELVNGLFHIFEELNITDTKDIKIKNLFKLIKEFKGLDKELQNLLVEFILILFIK